MFKATLSVRARILAIALIPSVALFVVGAGAAIYLVTQGFQARDWSGEVDRATAPGIAFAQTVQEERRLTLLKLGGDQQSAAALPAQRAKTDVALTDIRAAGDELAKINSSTIANASSLFDQLKQQVAAMRERIDAGAVPVGDTYTFFNQLLSVVSVGMQNIGHAAPDAGTASEEGTATALFQVAESMSRGNALAASAISSGGLTAAQLQEYTYQVGSYHTQLQNLVPTLTPDEQARYQAMTASPAWQQVSAMESAIAQRGTAPVSARNFPPLPLGVTEWQNSATTVSGELLDLWRSHHKYAEQFAYDTGGKTATRSIWGGVAVLVIAIVAFLITLRLANRFIGRLKRLRGETLALADERLPEVMERLRDGETVDLAAERAPLNYGSDEIGQVAEAFNRAQYAAVTAAVTEAKTREGVNAVFLNIAHRSQVVVHRQLEILDRAEFQQEDPDQLDMLFQLDHLATRERRNAENLIILGGEQPGRRWRNPVPLVELVRSAVAETEDYARVRTTRLPEVSIVGTVVADLIHMLAELVDNATSFSPPESRVEITGNIVGKGVVVEITDQGLGMPPEELARVNETLRNPPDFSVTTLSSDSRLGVFVVALLAGRNDTSVRLVESDYGGIRAIVLVPSSLIAVEAPTSTGDPTETNGRVRRRLRLSDDTAQRTPADRGGAAANWPSEEPPMTPSAPVPEPAPQRETPQARHVHRAQAEPAVRGRPDPRPADDRPVLPRRRRQASLAPQLAATGPQPAPRPAAPRETQAPAERPWSPEQARDLLSAIENGTRQGRQAKPDAELFNQDPRA
ncbi:nitrate- and nitrite sensing domain-containing protein [Amycolatopsis sp.]|uniref:sensor histidine kinase n=1 Tax=Amycolatopsis sp. TaxID=37632 RepID=UPI002C6927F6|nr:nitrate- and nitrite sensing domain-containing protein [Amycolatopsis sp.]HVV08237.1 nitrate- and nitrite sensing domain-containing protein [Amycolatopsis sp.]